VRLGNKLVVTSGLLSLAIAYAWVSTASGATSYAEIAGQMVFLGLGMGLTSAPATESIMGAVQTEKAGIGSAVNDATREVGGTLGVAVIGSVFASLYVAEVDGLRSLLPPELAERAGESVGAAFFVAAQLPEGPAAAVRAAAEQGFFDGLAAGCLVASGVALLGAGGGRHRAPLAAEGRRHRAGRRARAREQPGVREVDLSAMTVTVERTFSAAVADVWRLLSDLPRMAGFSREVESLEWDGAGGFTATNRRGGTTWTVPGQVVERREPTLLRWVVLSPDRPSSTWSYELADRRGATHVVHRFTHGEGFSLVRRAVEAQPARAAEIVSGRCAQLEADMQESLRLAEQWLVGQRLVEGSAG
jgi:uncharacterized protein YndB with AHSA1/START domain